MILGFDVSTTCIGWCLLRDDGGYLDAGYLQLDKLPNEYEKMKTFKKFLRHLHEDLQVKGDGTKLKICVEEPLRMFKTKSSMAQTIAMLQRFNGMICYSIYLNMKLKPILINPNSARKLAGIHVDRSLGQKAKQVVLEHVQSLNIFPFEFKKTGKPKNFMYDMCDAYIVSQAGLKL